MDQNSIGLATVSFLEGLSFEGVIGNAQQAIATMPLEEAVVLLHGLLRFPSNEPENRENAMLDLLRQNASYHEFLHRLNSLAQRKPHMERYDDERRARQIIETYSSVLANGSSLLGKQVATSSSFRLYLNVLLIDQLGGWGNYYRALLDKLHTLEKPDLAQSLSRLPNLYMFPTFDHMTGLRRVGQVFEKARSELVDTLFNEADCSVWRQFLLSDENFALVAHSTHMDDSPKEELDPEKWVLHFKTLVEIQILTYSHPPQEAFAFAKRYMEARLTLPQYVAERLDSMVLSGNWAIPEVAARLWEARKPHVTFLKHPLIYNARVEGKQERELWAYWYGEVAEGRITAEQAATLPPRIFAFIEGLSDKVEHNYRQEYWDFIKETIIASYKTILASPAMLNEEFQLLDEIVQLGVPPVQEVVTALMNSGLEREYLVRRVKAIGELSVQSGVVVTPYLLEHLVSEQDLTAAFHNLGALQARKRAGNFSLDDRVQRELEFGRFRELLLKETAAKGTKVLAYPEARSKFELLTQLPPLQKEPVLTSEELNNAGRAGYDAAGFVRFARQFSEHMSLFQPRRGLLIIGNNRYGQLFVVEPVEDILKAEGYRVTYQRVGSGEIEGDAYTIPHPFSDVFIQEIAKKMPHIIIVDGATPPNDATKSRFSSATLGYANFFAVFNHVRTDGDVEQYQASNSFPAIHLEKLRESPDFIRERERLTRIIGSGMPYRVVQWSPVLNESVSYGVVPVNHQPLDLAQPGKQPLVILANPINYGELGSFRGTIAFYWDDPEKHTQEAKTIIGFGSHGIEARTETRETQALIETVQPHIRRAAGLYLQQKH